MNESINDVKKSIQKVENMIEDKIETISHSNNNHQKHRSESSSGISNEKMG
jgi:hypothetical protein